MRPKAGQTVIIYEPPRRYSTNREPRIESRTVTKVGRKYFEVEGRRARFENDDWQIENTDNLRANFPEWAFPDMQALEEWQETNRLLREVGEYFRGFSWERKLTLPQLRVIAEAIAQPNPG